MVHLNRSTCHTISGRRYFQSIVQRSGAGVGVQGVRLEVEVAGSEFGVQG